MADIWYALSFCIASVLIQRSVPTLKNKKTGTKYPGVNKTRINIIKKEGIRCRVGVDRLMLDDLRYTVAKYPGKSGKDIKLLVQYLDKMT